jgi:hypothetical protein
MRCTPRRRRAPLLLLIGLTLAAPVPADVSLELKVKAAFLFNFARFVVWPASKFVNYHSPIYLCVVEPDPLGAVLEESVRGKIIDNRPVEVRRSAHVEDLLDCHVAYVGGDDSLKTATLLARLGSAGVMTVHEAGRPLAYGVARLIHP